MRAMQHTLLCVDDEQDNVDALERLFRKDYRVLKATSGKQALGLLKTEPVTVLICDQRMPEMTGVEFLTKSQETHPDSIRILLTGYTDVEAVVAAINSGQIYRYVTKPWDPRELVAAVRRAVERFEMASQIREKNAALEKALRELKSLDQAKSHFMILISHELKTPLTSVLSFLDLLKETHLDEEQHKFLHRIAQNALRLKEIIFDMLELVSAETNTISTKHEEVSAHFVIRQVLEELKLQADKKHQTIQVLGDDLKVKTDPRQLKNVLQRIMHNAIKFGDTGTPVTIEIASGKNAKGDTTVFSVENVGNPIPEDQIDRILKPFSVDENIMHHSKGLGLGLSISQALLRLHNSQLVIESLLSGVRVKFELPSGN